MWLIRLSLHQSGSRISRSGSWISQPGSRVNHRIVELLYGCLVLVLLLFMFVFCVGPTTMEPLFLKASFRYLLDLGATVCKQISCRLCFF